MTSLAWNGNITTYAARAAYLNPSNMTEEQLDEVLEAAEVPETELEEMDVELKRFIIENSGTNIEYVETVREEDATLRSGEYTIPDNELKIDVYAFRSGNILSIYPLYEWLKPVKPVGKDYFGYSTSSSYSAIANERSNMIWTKFSASDDWGEGGTATYTASSLYGYQHRGSSLGRPDVKMYIKGNFHYKVDINASNPIKKIVLAYAHDTTAGASYSYGITYNAASITVTPDENKTVGHKNGVFNLVYN